MLDSIIISGSNTESRRKISLCCNTFHIQLECIHLLRGIKSHNMTEQNPQKSISESRDISVAVYMTSLLHTFLQRVMRQRNHRRPEVWDNCLHLLAECLQTMVAEHR